MTETDAFKHSTPELYDRFMGPLLFEPYADLLAERSARLQPSRILETAAGTGIVTRALSESVPKAEIVATDINPAVLEFAATQLNSDRITFQPADAQDLPFDEGSFDLVVCAFGVMFFPDKIRAGSEARRVLRSGGRYLLVSFDRLALNPVPKAAEEAVASLFQDDPPRYMERGTVQLCRSGRDRGRPPSCGVHGRRPRDRRALQPRLRAQRRPGHRARLAVPRGDRTARPFRPRPSGRCCHRGTASVGRQGRHDVGPRRHRNSMMGSVVIDMSMSLDGYIAAPNDNPEQGLGEDGMRLHNWAFDDPSVFERVYGNLIEETGAVIMGRRSYDNSIENWGGKGPLGDVPCFVVTHRPPAGADPVFTFVTDGIESALAKAREAAGEKRIGLMGANIDQQFLAAGLVDELRIHVVDVLLGGGRRLFDVLPERVELEQTGLSQDDDVTHLEYRVLR